MLASFSTKDVQEHEKRPSRTKASLQEKKLIDETTEDALHQQSDDITLNCIGGQQKKSRRSDSLPPGVLEKVGSDLEDLETRTGLFKSSQATADAQRIMPDEEGSKDQSLEMGVKPNAAESEETASSLESMHGQELSNNESVKLYITTLEENVVDPSAGSENKFDEMTTQPKFLGLSECAAQEFQLSKVGEFKHYYRRRFRRHATEASSGEALDKLSSRIEKRAALLDLGNMNNEYSTPGATVDDARFVYRTRNSLSAITSNGYYMDEMSTKSMSRADLKSSTYPAKKKRKMQNVNEIATPVAEKKTYVSKENETSGNRSRQEVLHTKSVQKDAHRKWRDINLGLTDPAVLIGCKCKIFWPLDKEWYTGLINEYNAQSGAHHILYDDGDKENIVLAKELVKLYVSQEEMLARDMKSSYLVEGRKKPDYQEMAALSASLEDIQGEFGHGELVWAKIKGHPMWPAFVMDEKHADACGLEAPVRDGTLPVQFFGSYERARISSKQVMSFSRGLLCKLYSKCKKMSFDQGLEEAERYLKERRLPDIMSQLQDEVEDSVPQDEKCTEIVEEDEDFMGDERTHKTKKSVQSLFTCPIKLGALQVLSLGKIVRESEHFHDEHHIWTEGYCAVRKFTSTKDPTKLEDYKMEIMKDPFARTMPLFRVTLEDGEQIEGSTPSACWKKIYQRLDKIKDRCGNVGSQCEKKRQFNSGTFMFGFTNPRILRLIQRLPYARVCSKFTGWYEKATTDFSEQLLPAGYKPVEVEWKHPDRCSVCYLDEEYVNNLFLQCDKCRIVVHMHCYGESEPPNGHLWLCQLCRPGAPAKTPICCLCPLRGGAMKRTTDGRWAHLTCAMWIPETCFVDVKQMEPIDGLKSINKERWKLTCSICKVSYGVCIQCSELSCCVAYHILCARSAGLVLEVLEEPYHKDKELGEDSEQPVRLLSYCRRHRPPKEDRDISGQQALISKQVAGYCSDYQPPQSSSGCARTEPYNCAARRGRQEPEVRAAASAKRLYVEKIPYCVGGFCRRFQNGQSDGKCSISSTQAKHFQTNRSLNQRELKVFMFQGDTSEAISAGVAEESSNVFSMFDRYQQMRSSLKQRLTFGKSAIHGWGVFAKQIHRAGDMVIEYAGEIVRPIVADLRERLIYNSLVGAGTYMFRIDDHRVVDATRVGSIAHLINHSCEPNCFSRVVTISGEEHIIIFAKRDIEGGEELSYDYRFTSKGEQLNCYCGFPSCRGFVNTDDADEDPLRILVPRHEMSPWTPSIPSDNCPKTQDQIYSN